MKKSIFWLTSLLFAASFFAVSCSETDGEEDAYANWEERNQHYIDSIATVAHANEGDEVGQWKIVYSYKLHPLDINETGRVNDYVYCKILQKGDGTISPIATDSITADYRGKFINGTVFDQSFQGELDTEYAIPVGLRPGNVIVGWTTALMAGFGNMKAGDYWELYIPSNLAYGDNDYTGGSMTIPGKSVLVFDLHLSEVIQQKDFPQSKCVIEDPTEEE